MLGMAFWDKSIHDLNTFTMAYLINSEECAACGACVDACATGAVLVTDGVYSIDMESCASCGACKDVCPSGAVIEK